MMPVNPKNQTFVFYDSQQFVGDPKNQSMKKTQRHYDIINALHCTGAGK
jgi:hypothetical protein